MMTYQNYASLGVNLNRQKYGPLDISSVFTSTADLNYYLTKGAMKDNVSEYWLNITPYPYEGQIISLVENGNVIIYKIIIDNNIFKVEELNGNNEFELPENLATQDYVQNQIDELEKEWLPKMFVCCTQAVYNQMIVDKKINDNTPYLIV
jgi:hypothetical protein